MNTTQDASIKSHASETVKRFSDNFAKYQNFFVQLWGLVFSNPRGSNPRGSNLIFQHQSCSVMFALSFDTNSMKIGGLMTKLQGLKVGMRGWLCTRIKPCSHITLIQNLQMGENYGFNAFLAHPCVCWSRVESSKNHYFEEETIGVLFCLD